MARRQPGATLPATYANLFEVSRHSDGHARIVFQDQITDGEPLDLLHVVSTWENAVALAEAILRLNEAGEPKPPRRN